MENCRSNFSCASHFCIRIMSIKKNFIIIGITIIMYIINQFLKDKIPVEEIKWFLSCYFNDTIGSITFVAYCNLIFGFYDKKMIKLWHIELVTFFAGLCWVYIVPIFRKNTVSDVWDIVAYMSGGFLYWIIVKKNCKIGKSTLIRMNSESKIL